MILDGDSSQWNTNAMFFESSPTDFPKPNRSCCSSGYQSILFPGDLSRRNPFPLLKSYHLGPQHEWIQCTQKTIGFSWAQHVRYRGPVGQGASCDCNLHHSLLLGCLSEYDCVREGKRKRNKLVKENMRQSAHLTLKH